MNRYSLNVYPGNSWMDEDPEGDYVLYSDFICQHTEVTVNTAGESWCDQCSERVYPSPPFIEAGIVYTTTQEIEVKELTEK
jgi:hypothetical protein